MTLEEIAAALDCKTSAQIAAALGLDESKIRPSPMPRPTLVLDYRAPDGVRRWERLAKGEIPQLTKSLGLDPITGLKVELKKTDQCAAHNRRSGRIPARGTADEAPAPGRAGAGSKRTRRKK